MHLTTPLAVMDLADRRDARTFSRAMLLKGGPSSAAGASLVGKIVDTVVAPYRAPKGPVALAKYHAITGAFVSDLLFAARADRWSKLETNTNALTGLPGGATAFRTMREAMGAAGLLEELPGYTKTETVFGQVQVRSARTSFRPTPRLLEIAEEEGAGLARLADHFTLGELAVPGPRDVLEARAARLEKGQRPRKLDVDPTDPRASAIIAAMQRLNVHLMAPGRITGIAFAGLRRVFSNADQPGFAWQWHGRFYSMPGADGYEYMEGGAAARARVIRIDGAEVAPVDISASHLTILHGLLEVPFDPSSDLYRIPGVDREQVKEWLLFALGSSSASIGGPKYNRARAAALHRYPFLADLEELGHSTLDLQFHEAEILRLAMEDLAERGVGFLPVHDELMVAKGNLQMAEDALKRAFQRYFVGSLGKTAWPVPRLSLGLSPRRAGGEPIALDLSSPRLP